MLSFVYMHALNSDISLSDDFKRKYIQLVHAETACCGSVVVWLACNT